MCVFHLCYIYFAYEIWLTKSMLRIGDVWQQINIFFDNYFQPFIVYLLDYVVCVCGFYVFVQMSNVKSLIKWIELKISQHNSRRWLRGSCYLHLCALSISITFENVGCSNKNPKDLIQQFALYLITSIGFVFVLVVIVITFRITIIVTMLPFKNWLIVNLFSCV